MKIGIIDIPINNVSVSDKWEIAKFEFDPDLDSILNNPDIFLQDVLVINTEVKINGKRRTELSGVDLIYWLRFNKYNNKSFEGYIIASGFLPLTDAFKLDSKSLILMAPGHHYVQGPIYPDEIALILDKIGIISQENVPLMTQDSLKPYLRYAINLSEIRHKEANWWGVKNLIDSYYGVVTKKAMYPENINSELSKLKNHLADVFYSVESSNSNSDVKDECQKLQKKLYSFTTGNDTRVLLIDDQAADGWEYIYKKLIYSDEANPSFEALDFSDFSDIASIIEESVKKVKDFDPHFIILDLRLIPILDDKNAHKLAELSGIQVLKRIKESFPGLPILTSSASNKIWSYKKVISEGSDAYWIKGGVDNLLDINKSQENYKQLLEIISAFVNEEYQFLRTMYLNYSNFSRDEKFWWENGNWKTISNSKLRNIYKARKNKVPLSDLKRLLNCRYSNSKEEISRIIFQTMELYCTFLRKKYIQQTISEKSNWFYYSSLILHSSKLVEKIHGYTNEHFKKVGGITTITEMRDQPKAKVISNLRNKVAHFDESRSMNFQNFKNQFNEICEYLNLN